MVGDPADEVIVVVTVFAEVDLFDWHSELVRLQPNAVRFNRLEEDCFDS